MIGSIKDWVHDRLAHTNIKDKVHNRLSHTNINDWVHDRLSHTNIKDWVHDRVTLARVPRVARTGTAAVWTTWFCRRRV